MLISYLKTAIITIILIVLGVYFFNKFTNKYVDLIDRYVEKDYRRDSIKNDYLDRPIKDYLFGSYDSVSVETFHDID